MKESLRFTMSLSFRLGHSSKLSQKSPWKQGDFSLAKLVLHILQNFFVVFGGAKAEDEREDIR